MKIAIIGSWGVFVISILAFVISIFTSSTQTTWTVFSITMPLIGVSFWVAVILSIIHLVRSKKDE
ncbi:MAG: hypothetical protein IJ397_08655 [Lachnospiraceae bacterium]|nr:hypothetical protein [Lachnospiraceae bacterium]